MGTAHPPSPGGEIFCKERKKRELERVAEGGERD